MQGMKQSGYCSCGFCKEQGTNSDVNESVICFPYKESYRDIGHGNTLRSKEDHINDLLFVKNWKQEVTVIY